MIFEQFNYLEGHKPRLPKTLAWPVGVERLSELFATAPQASRIRIWFNARPTDGRMRMDQILVTGTPYQVFTVWYSVIGDPKWYLMVDPVDRTKKSEIRELLESQAFPAVDQWLRGLKTEVWLSSSKHLRCILHRTESTIEIKEDDC